LYPSEGENAGPELYPPEAGEAGLELYPPEGENAGLEGASGASSRRATQKGWFVYPLLKRRMATCPR